MLTVVLSPVVAVVSDIFLKKYSMNKERTATAACVVSVLYCTVLTICTYSRVYDL